MIVGLNCALQLKPLNSWMLALSALQKTRSLIPCFLIIHIHIYMYYFRMLYGLIHIIIYFYFYLKRKRGKERRSMQRIIEEVRKRQGHNSGGSRDALAGVKV